MPLSYQYQVVCSPSQSCRNLRRKVVDREGCELAADLDGHDDQADHDEVRQAQYELASVDGGQTRDGTGYGVPGSTRNWVKSRFLSQIGFGHGSS